jgi:hypothetical protein
LPWNRAAATAPVKEIAAKVESDRGLLMTIAFKATPELVDRVDMHRQAANDPHCTKSHAVKDLVERGLKSVGL